MVAVEEVLSPKVTLEELQEHLANDEETKNTIGAHITMVKDSILPVRLLFNDFLKTMATIDLYTDKTAQEKYMLVRTKVLELYTKLQELVTDFQKLQPLFDTMVTYFENNEQKFYPLETLSLVSEPVKPLASPSLKKSANKSNAGTPGSNPTPLSVPLPTSNPVLSASQQKQQRRPRTNTKRQPSASASGVPSVTSSGSAAMAGATPMMAAGVSPLNMVASPMNGISPGRKPQHAHHQTTPSVATISMQPSQPKQLSLPRKGTPSKTPIISAANLTPQSILNMSAFENTNTASNPSASINTNNSNNANSNAGGNVNNANSTGFTTDLDALDLNALELGSLNMDLLG